MYMQAFDITQAIIFKRQANAYILLNAQLNLHNHSIFTFPFFNYFICHPTLFFIVLHVG